MVAERELLRKGMGSRGEKEMWCDECGIEKFKGAKAGWKLMEGEPRVVEVGNEEGRQGGMNKLGVRKGG